MSTGKTPNLDGFNADIKSQQLDKLASIFPEAISEGKINWDNLRAALGEYISSGERYGLSWKGKSNIFAKIQEKTVSTLHPQPEESVDWDTTGNMFIEGDNLEALKVLHKAYYGKIKMIYIDPPYNTGNDFVYNDDFKKTRREQALEEGAIDDEGNVTRDDGLRVNTGGHKHSNWLDMMYPRLFLARNLLRQDGVIFVSIDDNEVHNLRLMMNEIFGEENFVHTLKWKRKKQPSFMHGHVASVMEYVLVYARDISKLEKLSIETRSDLTTRLDNANNPIAERILRAGVRTKLPLQDGFVKAGEYKIKTATIEYLDDLVFERGRLKDDVRVKARFRNKQDAIDEFCKEDLIFITTNTGLRRDLSDEEKQRRKTITDLLLDWGDNQISDKEMSELFPEGKPFDYPKPTQLMYNLVKSLDSDDFTVLDFFSGSGSTAHAVTRLNAEDKGSRKWISVQLPELIDERSEAFEAGYKTIAEISRERIRRAGAKISKDFADKIAGRDTPLDLGFRSYALGDSNFKKWNELVAEPDEIKQQAFDSLNPLEDGVSDDDLLTEILLKRGVSPLAEVETHDAFVFVPSENLAISLSRHMTEELFTQILAKSTLQIILLDQAFKDDVNLKTNLILQAEKQNISVEVL